MTVAHLWILVLPPTRLSCIRTLVDVGLQRGRSCRRDHLVHRMRVLQRHRCLVIVLLRCLLPEPIALAKFYLLQLQC